METGWIHSSTGGTNNPVGGYSVGTRLFVYSTPDNCKSYCTIDGMNSDNYDHWGGFIEYPNTPYPIGVYGYDTVQFKHEYEYYDQTITSVLSLTPISTELEGTYSIFGEKVMQGHYLSSHYCLGIKSMSTFHVGLEVDPFYQTTSANVQTAAGNIYGWGNGESPFTIEGQFSSSPTKSDWNIKYPPPPNQNKLVTFSGTLKDLACLWDNAKPCCVDPPEDLFCENNIVMKKNMTNIAA